MRVTTRASTIELYFPPLRAAGSALMLALFGVACFIIGGAATSGLLQSDNNNASSLLAFAFAGVFTLPLMAMGVWFMAIALWTAANSLTVEVSADGLRTERRCFGCALARRELRRGDLEAINTCLDAKYFGVFGAVRYYRLLARSGNSTLLIADGLKGADAAVSVRKLVVEYLRMPGLDNENKIVPAKEGLDE